jgi:selenide,water dikinase
VGTDAVDDAAVYQVSDALAIVATVDFFTPVVDDPFHFGAIAAANALSDVYAMGAEPLFALNIVGFPSNRLPLEVLQAILRGAQETAAKAGIPIIGGHTVDDLEPKFGLAVTGRVHPDRIWTNGGGRPGDKLILTKPLGLGIMTTALKQGLLDTSAEVEIQCIMADLNKTAAETLRSFAVHACTDVTGFGLLGHLREMAVAGRVDVAIEHKQLPLIPQAVDLATGGTVPGGTRNNRSFVESHIAWDRDVPETHRLLACDAQTSGGLLVAIEPNQAEPAVAALHRAGVKTAEIIGCITKPGTGRIAVH